MRAIQGGHKEVAARRSYERKVSEVFGYIPEASSADALRVREGYECPFIGARCVKPSQHRDYDSHIPFGACSVWHRGKGISIPKPHIICPIRFVQDRHIFLDASRLFEPRQGTEIIVLPEVGLPMGRIDYILSQYQPSTGEVVDFLVLEVMACSTTYTGDVLRSLHDILQGRRTERQLKYGINFRQVISRMMVQVLAKAHACEKWNKRMIWAVQDALYRYVEATTKVKLTRLPIDSIGNPPSEMSILFFVYRMDIKEDQEGFNLALQEIYGGTKESFSKILEPLELPTTERLFELIRQKIQSKESAFTLYTPLSEGLANVASEIVHESLIDYRLED
jgi:hypothetical protein